MSKQDKIEKSQKAKAAKQTTAKEALQNTVDNGLAGIIYNEPAHGGRYWQIAGTNYYGRNKVQLKGIRRVLNLKAGINEGELITTEPGENDTLVETGKVAPVPSHEWKFRITKGPDHPHIKA